MKVCKACGTLYNEKEGPCPKCYSDDLMRSGEAAHGGSAVNLRRIPHGYERRGS